jgi:hypothetical protein
MWMEAHLLGELLNGVGPMISGGGAQQANANKDNPGKDGK